MTARLGPFGPPQPLDPNRPVIPRPPRPQAPPAYVTPAFAMKTKGGWQPTSNDVRILKGFDQRSPEASVALVKQQLGNPLAPQNVRFLDENILSTHKAFTISVNNCFIPNSPHDQLLANLGANEAVVLGSLTQTAPAVLQVSVPGEADPRYYVKTPNGFDLTTKPAFVVYEGYVRRAPPGVEMRTVPWKSPALAGPTGTVTEQD